MKLFDDDKYLITASTPGEDKWSEYRETESKNAVKVEGGLIPGHAYSIIRIVNY
jgi:hypothetical protein